MSESDAISQDQDASQAEDQWQDKVLGDSIGYTRGLVAVLDTLTEGFRRRGRELEEQKQRLAILQSERRTVLEERARLEALLRSLGAERDGLRTDLEQRDRDLAPLRQELAQAQTALETRTREIQELQAAVAASARQAEALQVLETERRATLDERERLEANLRSLTAERDLVQTNLEDTRRELKTLRHERARYQTALEGRSREIQELQATVAASARQAEELREIVRGLERDRESKPQHIARMGEMERELLQVRDAAARAEDAQVALRERLAHTEHLLETARGDLTKSQQSIESLKTSLDEEKITTSSLQAELQSQTQDLSRLDARTQALLTVLTDIAGILGTPAALPEEMPAAEAEAARSRELIQAVRRQAAMEAEALEEIAALRSVVASARELLGITGALPDPFRNAVAEGILLTDRIQQVAAEGQRYQEQQAEWIQRAEQLRGENDRLARQVRELIAVLESLRAQPGSVAQAPPGGQQEREIDQGAAAVGSEIGSAPDPRDARIFAERPAIMMAECTLKASGEESQHVLRGKVTKVTEFGLVVTLEKDLLAGGVLMVRLLRGLEGFQLPGRVVRVQRSSPGRGGSPAFDHLIRFDHPNRDAAERLKAFLS